MKVALQQWWDVSTSLTLDLGESSPIALGFDGVNLLIKEAFTDLHGEKRSALVAASLSGAEVPNYPLPPHVSYGEGMGFCYDGMHVWGATFYSSGPSSGVYLWRGSEPINCDPARHEPAFPCPPDANLFMCFDGNNIWLGGINGLAKISIRDNSVIGPFPIPRPPSSMCVGGGYVWITDGRGAVIRIRTSDNDWRHPTGFTVGSQPMGICFDGSHIWIALSGNNSVVKLNPEDGSIMGAFPVGSAPCGICFDGENIWVANKASNDVTKLRASDGAVLGTYTVGIAPVAVCFDGLNIWVANSGSNSLSKL